jgi:hypothetical protein
MELVIFCEEPSAKMFLDEFVPRHLPQGIKLVTIPHNGKSDLQKSLPRKLKAWRNPEAKFVVLHDKDHNDCIQLKAQLRHICSAARTDIQPLIRIACHELESWYLGDFTALQNAFPNFKPKAVKNAAKFRNVDALSNASEELTKLVPEYQKRSGSRQLGYVMEPDNNTSHSFRVFWDGIQALIA